MLYKLENLRRVHGTRTVLDIGRLEIEPHKVYTLIGPNGAGKTSLLKILAFLDRPTSGSLEFLGRQTDLAEKDLYELRRRVVLLDQTPIMFTGSVHNNVEFGLKVRNVPHAERRQRIHDALDLVGMANFTDYNARGLSGGETKRVALARALVLRPDVLLCDEPTANVDNENQEIILNIIERINKEQRTSVIFSTHYLSQGQRLADQTLLLQQGELSDVANENIFKATVIDRREDSLIFQLTGQLFFELPADILPGDVSVVKLHIDPESIVFRPGRGEVAGGNTLSGHLTELRQDSGRIRITIDTGVRLVFTLTMERYRQERPSIGDKVDIFIPFSAVGCTRVDTPIWRF